MPPQIPIVGVPAHLLNYGNFVGAGLSPCSVRCFFCFNQPHPFRVNLFGSVDGVVSWVKMER